MTRKFFATVLSITVVLGIVSCSSEISEVRDNEIGITASTETEQAETTIAETEQISIEITAESSETSEEIIETEPSSTVSETTQETTAVSETTQVLSPSQTEAQPATPTEVPVVPDDPDPTVAPDPTATPEPTATPIPTPTPEPTATPVPVMDADASAREHGYEIIDIDMGDGTTQRIYGYYVDMSGLTEKINDYRESIGLSRLPTDSGQSDAMRIRAAEITVLFSHWRPNGNGGGEVNIVGGTQVDDCYNTLYNSEGHRGSWTADDAIGLYCVGFYRMMYHEDTGTWSGGSNATVVYMSYA